MTEVEQIAAKMAASAGLHWLEMPDQHSSVPPYSPTTTAKAYWLKLAEIALKEIGRLHSDLR